MRHRLQDQQVWYGAKARWNRSRALTWALTVLILQIVGLSAAVARVAQWIEVSLIGVAAAVSAAATAWSHSCQYENPSTPQQ
jgi:hypothetical protein